RHRDDRFRRVAGPLAHLLEYERGEFLRRVFAIGDSYSQHLSPIGTLALDNLVRDELEFLLQVRERSPHEPLDAENRVLGIGERAVAGRGADEDRAIVVEADDARHERDTVGVADNDRPAIL